MKHKPTAIVLGGTAPHVLLVKKLKQRGYYVVLIDYLDNPPAKQYADEHLRESTLDKEKVLSISVAYNAAIVISSCIDQANSVCCYVAEKLGLPHPYSYETSINVTDKGLMKKIMIDNEIPTSPYILVKKLDDIFWEKVEYPSVVKPVDCNSSKGVCRVDSDEETRARVMDAINMSRTHTAIIEGYNEGPEIQVDCVATEKGVKVVLTRQKQKVLSKNNEMVLQSFGSIFPAPLNAEYNKQVTLIAEKIATAFGLKNTPFFYQAIITDSGIKVLEFAPRVGGGLSYYMLKEIAKYDAVEAVIQSFIGEPICYTENPSGKFYSTNILYMKPGEFDCVEGLSKLKEDGIVYETFVMKDKGAVIDSDMRSSNRVAAFILEADSADILAKKAEFVFPLLEIYDSNGTPLLNRSIYPYN